MMEAVGWSFIPAAHAAAFGGGSRELKLANPIAAEMSDMRPSLLPGLIAAGQRNADRGAGDVALFEVGAIYAWRQAGRPAPSCRRHPPRRRQAEGHGRHWRGTADKVDVFDAKADALAALEACGPDAAKLQIGDGAPAWYHPGRSGTMQARAEDGARHFRRIASADAGGARRRRLVRASRSSRRHSRAAAKATRTKPRLDAVAFQAVRRDFAFVVARDQQAATLLRAAAGADKKLIVGVSVFDLFEGESLGAGKKSLAIEVTLQPADKTLTDDEIDAVSKKIVEKVGQRAAYCAGNSVQPDAAANPLFMSPPAL